MQCIINTYFKIWSNHEPLACISDTLHFDRQPLHLNLCCPDLHVPVALTSFTSKACSISRTSSLPLLSLCYYPEYVNLTCRLHDAIYLLQSYNICLWWLGSMFCGSAMYMILWITTNWLAQSPSLLLHFATSICAFKACEYRDLKLYWWFAPGLWLWLLLQWPRHLQEAQEKLLQGEKVPLRCAN